MNDHEKKFHEWEQSRLYHCHQDLLQVVRRLEKTSRRDLLDMAIELETQLRDRGEHHE